MGRIALLSTSGKVCYCLGHVVIKRIELVNFMSHEHSVLELAEGLNVLVGPNNCGKSAVVTALQILCYNDTSTYVLRHGASQCSIELETSDGHVVRWSRKKSGSPRYEIDGQPYDRLGKGNVPEALHEILQMPRVRCDKDEFDVHFGLQRQPVFLLNDPPRAAADFFASSSDASRLVEMQSLHKHNVRDANVEKKRAQRELAETTATLKSLEPLDQVLDELKLRESEWNRIQQADAEMESLRIQLNALGQTTRQLAGLSDRQEKLRQLDPPPAFCDTGPLADTLKQITQQQKLLDSATQSTRLLETLQEPPHVRDVEPLQQHLATRRQLQRLLESRRESNAVLQRLTEPPGPADTSPLANMIEKLRSQTKLQTKLAAKLDSLAAEGQVVQQAARRWAADNPHCPVCGSLVEPDGLLEGGHNHGAA